MADLISRKAAMNLFMKKPPEYYHTSYIVGELNCLPAVDATPVVHGQWVNKNEEGIYGPAFCSVCDFELRIDDMPYCPKCGAKMDAKSPACGEDYCEINPQTR